ncbi:MAG: multicopper oxidase family protein [Acidithiobacillus sp.]|uniref:multicopper oxidase family protein n=1 Tax=Acidithiobacillus sp. TaxID=1872118 RepID=UPI003D07DA95
MEKQDVPPQSPSTSRRLFLQELAALVLLSGTSGWLRAADMGHMAGMAMGAGSKSMGMGSMAATTPVLAHPPAFASALPIPPLYAGERAVDGVREYHLGIAAGRAPLASGLAPTPTWGYRGALLGPSLQIPRGEPVRIWVHNGLDQSTTTHWHGAHVPGDMDGGPQSLIAPGQTWHYHYTIDQPEATLWYHPHPNGRTGPHVYAGLAGLYLVQDGSAERLGLPRRYGIDDVPIIVQDRLLDDRGRLVYMPKPMDVMGMKGNRFLINGRESPVLKAPAGWLRLRLLNGSNARLYNFAFSDDRVFYQIATDAGFLETPVAMHRLLLAPAERAEILVDLRRLQGRRLRLRSDSAAVVPSLSTMPMDSDAYDRSVFDLLEIQVGPPLGPGGRLPEQLTTLAKLPPAQRERHFSLQGMMDDMGGKGMGSDMGALRQAAAKALHNGPGGMSMGIGNLPLFTINHLAMDMQRIDLSTRLGTTEVWEVVNQAHMAHTFHVHGVSFRILSRNGQEPPPGERGWKDVALIRRGETLRLGMTFTQPASKAFPFMYHCHMLEHEDNGMMGQFTVLRS